MRVGENSNNKKTQDGQTAQATSDNQQQQYQQYQQQPGSNQGNQGYAFDDDPFANLGVSTLTGGVDTEGFAAFSDEMVALSKDPEITARLKVEIVPVTNQTLILPVLAMCARHSSGTVTVYSLLIEGMLSSKIEPYIEQVRDPLVGQRDIVIDRPTSRAFDPDCRAVIVSAVATRFNVQPNDVLLNGLCVIPADVDMTSKALARTFFDCGQLALIDVVGGKVGRITPRELCHPAVEMRQHTEITPGESVPNRIGRLVASDFNTSVRLVKTNVRRQDPLAVHNGNREFNLAEVKGYIDFNIWAGGQQQPPQYMGQQPNQQPQPGYVPVVVLTEVAGLANNGKSIEDLRTQLLGLCATLPITTAQGWVRVFEAAPNRKSKKDTIGLLALEHDPYGIEGNYGKAVVESNPFNKPTEEGKYTPIQFASMWCTPQVAVALDVENGGRLEWVQSSFTEAAKGVTTAISDIIRECDELTNGIFTRQWAAINNGNAQANPVRPDVVTVHLGTYTGEDGKTRDLRTLDYLHMLKSSPKDLEFVATVTSAMTPGLSNTVTLSDRRAAIVEAPDCKITGMADRVYFTPAFINCLVASLFEAGVKIRTDDHIGYDMVNRRAGLGAEYAGAYNASGFYQPTYGQMGPQGQAVGGVYANPIWRGR